jgi:D-sedoheptulose 7-phosphate isomerase
MDLTPRITGHFQASAQLKLDAADLLAPPIAAAATMIVNTLLHDRKVLVCGNGGSAALAQYYAACMLNRFDMERPGLATITLTADNPTLTCIANDIEFSQVYSKQLLALGHPGDVLLVLSTSGNSPNILNAITAAHERDMHVVALTGGDGGKMVELLRQQDIHLGVPQENAARVQELFILILHCLCDSIDCLLLGVE